MNLDPTGVEGVEAAIYNLLRAIDPFLRIEETATASLGQVKDSDIRALRSHAQEVARRYMAGEFAASLPADAPQPATQRSILDPSVYDEMDQHRAPAKQRSKPDLWWNGFRRYDERSGTYPSVAEHEDTNHDIPLYSGVNPCNAPLSETAPSGTAKVSEGDKEFAQREAKNIINSADAQCFRWLLKHHSGSGKAIAGVGMRCWIGGVEFRGDDVVAAILEAIDREDYKAAPSPDGNDSEQGGAR